MSLRFHPLANIFPLIEGSEFDELVRDIKANGLRELVVMAMDQVLDGRNRYRALIAAGLIAETDTDGLYFRQFDALRDGDMLAFVLSKNLARRHLNESQRAMVAARIATMHHGGNRRADQEANLPLETSIGKAAENLNISPRLVKDARAVQNNGTPELRNAVDRGKLTVTAAKQASKLAPAVQEKIVRAAEEGRANVVRTVIKQEARAQREADLGAKQMALPDRKYGVILADPEWEFTAFSVVTGMDRAAVNHYPTSPTHEIADRDVEKLAAKDCLLALWCTDLPRGLNVLKNWGFEYRSYLVWVKDVICIDKPPISRFFEKVGPPGTGYWSRDRDEILLVGVRGDIPAPAPGTQIESVIFAARPKVDGARRGKHSAKPDDAHRWIETNWPHLPKIELNARRRRDGWDAWGNEITEIEETEECTGASNLDISQDREPCPEDVANGNPPARELSDDCSEGERSRDEAHIERGGGDVPEARGASAPLAAAPFSKPTDDFEIPAFLRRSLDSEAA